MSEGNEAFESFRSLINRAYLRRQDREDLIERIWRSYEEDQADYERRWLPYLERVSHDWTRTLVWAVSIEEMHQAREVMPFAHIGLMIDEELPSWQEDVSKVPPWCEGLVIYHPMDDEAVAELCDALMVDELKALHLFGADNTLGARGMEAIGQAPWSDALKTLHLNSGAMDDACLHVMAQAPYRLGALSLQHSVRDTDVSVEAFEALLASAVIAHAHTLEFVSMHLNPPHIHVLAKQRLPHLEVLTLRDNPLGHEGLRRLLSAPWWSQLLALDLSGTSLGHQSASMLARAGVMSNLHVLDLEVNALGDGGVLAIIKSPDTANLRELRLFFNDVESPDTMRAIVDAEHLHRDIREAWEDVLSDM